MVRWWRNKNAGSSQMPADIVCVIGMHRSGTSLCANVLQALGIDMAEDPGRSPHNPAGHYERSRINDLHDEIFAAFDRPWTSAAHILALPPHWLDHPRVAAVREALIAYVGPQLRGGALWGVKDPRTARLLPLWRQVFTALEATPRFIFCVRDPAQVARSLQARDRFAQDHAEYRWLTYNADAVNGIGADPVCVVPYTAWFEDAAAVAGRLAAFLRIPPPLQGSAAGLVDPRLRHDAPELQPHGCAARFYRQLAGCTGQFTPDTRALALCLQEFVGQIQPLLVEGETLRASVAAQNRVIRDLNGVITQLRQTSRAAA